MDCPDDGSVPCLGGYARLASKVREIRSSVKDSLLLNAGDECQGVSRTTNALPLVTRLTPLSQTLFYSFWGGEKIAETLNYMNCEVFFPRHHHSLQAKSSSD